MAAPLVTLPSPLPSPDDVRRKRDADVLAAVAGTSTRTALVSAVTGSLVSLTNLLGDDLGDAARVSGFALTVGDLVLLAPVVGQAGDVEWIVVGKILPTAAVANSALDAGLVVNGPLVYVGSGTPTVTALGNAGSGAAISAFVGTDDHGEFTLTTGTGAVAGFMARITFANAMPNTTYSVWVSPRNAVGASALIYPSTRNVAYCEISAANAPASSTAIGITYRIERKS